MALENNLSKISLTQLYILGLSAISYMAPNSCLRLRTQIELKVGIQIPKGNNFVAVLETSRKTYACPIDWTVAPIDQTTQITREHLSDRGSDRSDLGVPPGLLFFSSFLRFSSSGDTTTVHSKINRKIQLNGPRVLSNP